MDLDRNLINLRIDIVERNLKEINNIVTEGEEEFLKSYRSILAGRHAIFESIEACIDIGNHIIASKGQRRPEDYKDVFVILQEDKIIPRNLSGRLQNMARFRNLLVHSYVKIDDRKVFAIMKKDVKDIKEFVRFVLKFMIKGRKIR